MMKKYLFLLFLSFTICAMEETNENFFDSLPKLKEDVDEASASFQKWLFEEQPDLRLMRLKNARHTMVEEDVTVYLDSLFCEIDPESYEAYLSSSATLWQEVPALQTITKLFNNHAHLHSTLGFSSDHDADHVFKPTFQEVTKNGGKKYLIFSATSDGVFTDYDKKTKREQPVYFKKEGVAEKLLKVPFIKRVLTQAEFNQY